MALGRDYDRMCPIFNWNTRAGGVLFPYYPLALGQIASNAPFINFDGADTSSILARCRFPMRVRLITCEVYPVSDDQGLKTGAATAEPIIAVAYGTIGLASAGAGTDIAVITCDGSGALSDHWAGTTTATTIETTQELAVYLKQAAATSGASGLADGGGSVVLWLALANAPA